MVSEKVGGKTRWRSAMGAGQMFYQMLKNTEVLLLQFAELQEEDRNSLMTALARQWKPRNLSSWHWFRKRQNCIFSWHLWKPWVWKRHVNKYKCLTYLCWKEFQRKNRSRRKTAMDEGRKDGLSFRSVEPGWWKARDKAVEKDVCMCSVCR